MSELIEAKGFFPGFQTKGYPGAFPPKVEKLIRDNAESPCLHLFSGTSDIGDVRVDLERPEATDNKDVFDFIAQDERHWKFVVLDIPYEHQGHRGNLKREYGSSPVFQGFKREKTYFCILGAWQFVRVLTWLKREGEYLQ